MAQALAKDLFGLKFNVPGVLTYALAAAPARRRRQLFSLVLAWPALNLSVFRRLVIFSLMSVDTAVPVPAAAVAATDASTPPECVKCTDDVQALMAALAALKVQVQKDGCSPQIESLLSCVDETAKMVEASTEKLAKAHKESVTMVSENIWYMSFYFCNGMLWCFILHLWLFVRCFRVSFKSFHSLISFKSFHSLRASSIPSRRLTP